MSKYFYHGVINKKNVRDLNYSLDHLINLLNSGGIKSKKLLGIKENYGFNGLDYVCVCKKLRPINNEVKRFNAFSIFIEWNFALVISNDIDAIKIGYMNEESISPFDLIGIDKRYSDLFDEYQVKDIIPINKIVAIAIPFKRINKIDKEILMKLKTLVNIAKELSLDIVDSSSMLFPYDYEFKKTMSIGNNYCKNKLNKLI